MLILRKFCECKRMIPWEGLNLLKDNTRLLLENLRYRHRRF